MYDQVFIINHYFSQFGFNYLRLYKLPLSLGMQHMMALQGMSTCRKTMVQPRVLCRESGRIFCNLDEATAATQNWTLSWAKLFNSALKTNKSFDSLKGSVSGGNFPIMLSESYCNNPSMLVQKQALLMGVTLTVVRSHCSHWTRGYLLDQIWVFYTQKYPLTLSGFMQVCENST